MKRWCIASQTFIYKTGFLITSQTFSPNGKHPSIHLYRLSLMATAGLEPIPDETGREAGYTMYRSPVLLTFPNLKCFKCLTFNHILFTKTTIFPLTKARVDSVGLRNYSVKVINQVFNLWRENPSIVVLSKDLQIALFYKPPG